MKNYLNQIDILRLAGVSSILGIDITDSQIRLVELRKQGNPLNKYKPRFVFGSSFTTSLDEDQNLETKAELLRNLFAEHNIETKRAVVGIHSKAAKTIEAVIPGEGKGNIEEWIRENHEKLLGLPLPMDQFSFSFGILGEVDNGLKVDVVFIRREEIERARKLAQLAGLELLGMSSGSLEKVRAVSGQILNGVGLTSQYDVPACLALKGFLPELGGIEFLEKSELVALEVKVYRSLFQRTVMAGGAVLIALLLLPTIFSFYFSNQVAKLDEELMSSGLVYSEVKSLESQVQQLERQLQGQTHSLRRSGFAKVLYDAAKSSKDGIWFSRLTISSLEGEKTTVSVTGYARRNEDISIFMKALQEAGISSDVSLVRSGVVTAQSQTMRVRNVSPTFIFFEIKATIVG